MLNITISIYFNLFRRFRFKSRFKQLTLQKNDNSQLLSLSLYSTLFHLMHSPLARNVSANMMMRTIDATSSLATLRASTCLSTGRGDSETTSIVAVFCSLAGDSGAASAVLAGVAAAAVAPSSVPSVVAAASPSLCTNAVSKLYISYGLIWDKPGYVGQGKILFSWEPLLFIVLV